MAPLLRLALLVTALAFAFFSAPAFSGDYEAGPAVGNSLNSDDLTMKSGDVDNLDGHSGNPDNMAGRSEDPDHMVGGSEDPDDTVAESEDLDKQVGRSQQLDGLPEDSGSGSLPDPMPQLVAEPSPPGPDDGSEVHAAWRAVQAAERNMEASNDIYANMIDNDYPRGEQRARIIEDRRASFEEVNQARLRYNELRGE